MVNILGKVTAKFLESLKFDLEKILNWFDVNLLKPNLEIFQHILCGKGITKNCDYTLTGLKLKDRLK